MNSQRALIDPEGRHPADGLRVVEEHALRVLALLPDAEVQRTHHGIQIEHGGDDGIVALVTREALELRLPTIEWTTGAFGPAASSRLWRRVEWTELGESQLADLLRRCRVARRRQFRKCRFCGERTPPERSVKANVCHGCAERHLGVVF